MREYEDYYVVGIYSIKTGIPTTIYKITTSIEEAVQCYFSYWENPCCYVGFYHKNELYELGKFSRFTVEGPGIFKNGKATISLEDIENYKYD